MQALGDQLLAGAALANHQHRTVERSGAARALDRIENDVALPDECITPLHAPTVGDKHHLLARYFALPFVENTGFSRWGANITKLARSLNGIKPYRALNSLRSF